MYEWFDLKRLGRLIPERLTSKQMANLCLETQTSHIFLYVPIVGAHIADNKPSSAPFVKWYHVTSPEVATFRSGESFSSFISVLVQFDRKFYGYMFYEGTVVLIIYILW